MKIDKYLDKYVGSTWWFNADWVIAAAIASACRHMRKDGYHAFNEDELFELKKLERYMRAYSTDAMTELGLVELEWLNAEAMWLLSKWFVRMWD